MEANPILDSRQVSRKVFEVLAMEKLQLPGISFPTPATGVPMIDSFTKRREVSVGIGKTNKQIRLIGEENEQSRLIGEENKQSRPIGEEN